MTRNTQIFDELFNAIINPESFLKSFEVIHSNIPPIKYPPTNIFKNKNNEIIFEIAATGFEKDEIEVSHDTTENTIIVSATKKKDECCSEDGGDNETEVFYFNRTLSQKNFEFKTPLPIHSEIKSAELKNGLLTIVINSTQKENTINKVDIK